MRELETLKYKMEKFCKRPKKSKITQFWSAPLQGGKIIFRFRFCKNNLSPLFWVKNFHLPTAVGFLEQNLPSTSWRPALLPENLTNLEEFANFGEILQIWSNLERIARSLRLIRIFFLILQYIRCALIDQIFFQILLAFLWHVTLLSKCMR